MPARKTATSLQTLPPTPNGNAAPVVSRAVGATLSISPIARERLLVPIVGTSPLIVHNWSQKARQAMLDTQQGRKQPKQPRDPQADYQAAFYHTETGYGFPVLAFKSCTVDAARFYGKDVRMTDLRQFLFFSGQVSKDRTQLLLPLETSEPWMREDVVRLSSGGTDLRYRPEFVEWRTVLDITYVSSALDRNSVLSLVDAGGLGVGVGEWRPEKSGLNGTFAIDTDREVLTEDATRRS
jgi:hypothetical protein